MTDAQKATIKEYVTTLNSNIAEGELLDLVVDTVSDRVLLYLNETTIAENLERVIAQVIVSVYQRTEEVTTGSGRSVASVADNGQTVAYHLSPAQYMHSIKDQDLFTGFERLLSPYRRIHVITS
jgi:hypothetical protein